MALRPLSALDDYDLAHSDQDCRGRAAVDLQGNRIGTVREMIIDTARERVDSLVIDNGMRVAVEDIALRGDAIIVRDAADNLGDYAQVTQTTTTTTQQQAVAAPQVETARADFRRAAAGGEGVAIPVIEEQLKIGKRTVDKGGVRVHQHVTERPVEETVRLREEQVNVERRPVNQPVDPSQLDAFREGVIEITETREEAVVAKDARVVEEVVVNKQVSEHDEVIRDTVRRTDVEVEDLSNTTTNRATNKR